MGLIEGLMDKALRRRQDEDEDEELDSEDENSETEEDIEEEHSNFIGDLLGRVKMLPFLKKGSEDDDSDDEEPDLEDDDEATPPAARSASGRAVSRPDPSPAPSAPTDVAPSAPMATESEKGEEKQDSAAPAPVNLEGDAEKKAEMKEEQENKPGQKSKEEIGFDLKDIFEEEVVVNETLRDLADSTDDVDVSGLAAELRGFLAELEEMTA